MFCANVGAQEWHQKKKQEYINKSSLRVKERTSRYLEIESIRSVLYQDTQNGVP